MGRPAVVFICDCEGMHCARTLTEDGSSQPPKRLVHKTLLTSEFREIYVPVIQPSQTNYSQAHMHQRVIQSGNCLGEYFSCTHSSFNWTASKNAFGVGSEPKTK